MNDLFQKVSKVYFRKPVTSSSTFPTYLKCTFSKSAIKTLEKSVKYVVS